MTVCNKPLLTIAQIRQLEVTTIKQGRAGIDLMRDAGEAAFRLIRQRWPRVNILHIICGVGNNGGDGFVIAKLAKLKGLHVHLHIVGDVNELQGEALLAYLDMQELGIKTATALAGIESGGHVLMVDALFGIGLTREISGKHADIIEWINQEDNDVLAIDIPSGLCADTGTVMGVAVEATATITFIGRKQGLYMGAAKAYRGEVYGDDLSIDAAGDNSLGGVVNLLDFKSLMQHLPARTIDAHKGHYGHVLVVGGNYGFAGAALMAGRAALRVGAGLLSVATRPEHIATYVAAQPEIMAHGISQSSQFQALLKSATHIVIGPGLGQDEWAMTLLDEVIKADKPTLLDADALNLIAKESRLQLALADHASAKIITPHPGEAARLLSCTVAQIQSQRKQAVLSLQQQYSATVVLKGAATLVADHQQVALCDAGNPYMASGGMGDVLSGVIAGLWAQGMDADRATQLGVEVHALAADQLVAQGKAQGLLATDLLEPIRALLNSI